MNSRNSCLGPVLLVGIALFVSVLLLVGYILDGRTATVVAYNGFQSTVTVSMADESVMIPSRESHTFSIPAAPVDFHAVFTEGGDIEVVSADLTEHGRGLVVYNVGNRATLTRAYIVYGRGDVPDEDPITEQVTVHRGIDYIFHEPPDEKDITGDRDVDSLLTSTDASFTHLQNIDYLYEIEASAAGQRYARAVMREGPVDERVVQAAADAPEAQADMDAWCREVIAEVPDGLERHAFCQTARTDTDAVFDEYTALVAENPDSAFYHYLLGLLSERPEALALYSEATELDPLFGWAYVALGNDRVSYTDDWAGALQFFAEACHVDSSLCRPTLDARLRLRTALGQSPGDIARMWREEVGDPSQFTGLTYGRMLDLAQTPGSIQSTIQTLESEFTTESAVHRSGTLADACVAASDFACLRTIMTGSELLKTYLVLSDAATADERTWVSPAGYGATVQNTFGAVHELREGRDASAHLETIEQSSPDLAALLRTPPTTVAEAAPIVQTFRLAWRPIVWFSLYRLTDNPAFLTQARVFALPTDLPITERS